MSRPPWNPSVALSDGGIRIDDLHITFHRTVRVSDNDKTNDLPPSFGTFPLYHVKDYARKLPQFMVAKGGLFMPMYQREAMWIGFHSSEPYAMKIYIGGINAVSGEPSVETAATNLRRQAKLRENQSLQDYVVVPDQYWLDGIAVGPGKVRQFVAAPTGSGYSVEAQITGEEVTAGIQFEITPQAPYRIRGTIQESNGAELDSFEVWNFESVRSLVTRLNLDPDDTLRWEHVDLTQRDDEIGSIIDKRRSLDPVILWLRSPPKRSQYFDMRQRQTQVMIRVNESTTPVSIKVSLEDTVSDFKFLIQDALGITVAQQDLFLAGKPISGSITLRSLGVAKNTEIRIYTETFPILVKTLMGKMKLFNISSRTTVSNLKDKISDHERCLPNQLRIIFGSRDLDDDKRLVEYNVQRESIVFMVYRLRGGGGGNPPAGAEMGLAAGGIINQAIAEDDGVFEWDSSQTKTFNVQILNSAEFKAVTGEKPVKPREMSDFEGHFYELFEEPSRVSGAFDAVKSINQIDGKSDPDTERLVVRLRHHKLRPGLSAKGVVLDQKDRYAWDCPKCSAHNVSTTATCSACSHALYEITGFFNPWGPLVPFRSRKEIEDSVREKEAIF